MEIQICNDCLRDSGFESFGTAFAGDEPFACDACGNEFWSLHLAAQPALALDAPQAAIESDKSGAAHQ